MSKPIIEVKNLSKVYNIGHEQKSAPGTLTFRDSLTQTLRKPLEIFTGHRIEQEKFWALKDVNFEVSQGDVVGIIGRNGSGKSTLLKVLSRIVEPTEGEITMRGRVASLLEVGTGFHPELTGRENVYFNGAILGMSQKEIKSKFDEIVAFSEVEKFLDTPVKFYSSGMYVRLAFAVAAHLDPDILIVDEVLAVGDAAFQKKCLGKMKDVAGQGRTVLFVSHSMSAVRSLCTSAIVMSEGKVQLQTKDLREAALFYGNSIVGAGKTSWKGPKSFGEELRIDSAAISSTSTSLSREGSYNLTVKGEILQDVSDLNVGYALYDEEDTMLYWSFSTDTKGIGPLTKGRFSASSKLPLDTLNAGKYRIEILASQHNKRWLLEPTDSPVSLQFSIVGPMSESKYWVDRRPGLIAPSIEWDTNVLSR